MPRAIDVAREGHPILVHLAQVRQAEDLEAAGVGEDRPVPGHEPMQPSQPGDPLRAWAQAKVIRVAKDDLGADEVEVCGRNAFDRCLRAYRHELRRVDRAVRRLQPTQTCVSDAGWPCAEANRAGGHRAAG